MAADRWTGKGGRSWFDARNWRLGVPVTQQAVAFSDGGTWAISLAGTADATAGAVTVLADALTFSGGTLDLAAAMPKQGYPVDMAIGSGGSVTVAASATLTSHYIIDVGSVVAGSLTAGALTVHGTIDGAFLDVIDGAAKISGPGAHVALIYDGYSGEVSDGSLTISAGGTLDTGPDSLNNNYSSLEIGAATGDGLVSVTGTGSVLSLSGLTFGNDAAGTLDVGPGGAVRVNYVSISGYGEEHIAVHGKGAVLSAVRGIAVGDDGSLSGLTLTATDGGSVDAGTYGLALRYGVLLLDSSAQVSGPIYSQVGQIGALARSANAPGTVTLGQAITLDSNQGGQGQYAFATSVYSEGGAVLKLDGQISSIGSATLVAGSGTVVLDNGGNNFAALGLYDARLEIAATGAAGAGTIGFAGGAAQSPVLQIDAGVTATNTIAGFAGNDTIDLSGFAFGSGVTEQFAAGTLTLTSSQGSESLSLSGTYSAGDFVLSSDHHGGTAIKLTHG